MLVKIPSLRFVFARQIPSFAALFVTLLCAASLHAQSAENCSNGIDDDGDGFIDCFDTDCGCQGPCKDFYYNTCKTDCFFIPPCDTISLGVQWESPANTGTYSTLVAGDLDGDGIPEIVTYRVESKEIFILNGATGAVKVQIDGLTKYPGGTSPAIADLDGDGFGEIVMVGEDLSMRCFEHDGKLKYTSNTIVGYHTRYQYSSPNIADFDYDGKPEINIGNQVFNGQTGVRLASGGIGLSAGEHPARRDNGFSFNSPVAIDVLPDNFCPDCDGLEIVAGNQVLSVNLVTGAVTPVVTAPAPFSDGFTSVVDFDLDGDLDAIVQGKKGNQNTVYVWELETPTILREFALFNNYQEGASRVNVADLNGDGQLEVSFVSYPTFYALKNDFSVLWTLPTNDASAVTCSSVFDFCGDGSADVIYRGESFLQILEGATGKVKWQDECRSETHIENPLILDVDADGQTEVVIQCGGADFGAPGVKAPYSGKVVVYEAVGTPGIASRKVWNQHAYFNTNINDDLSVPRRQQNPQLIGDKLRLNSFLNQYFNPTFPAADGALTFDKIVCQGDSLAISVRLCNLGANLLPAHTPVSLYKGNPQKAAATWLGARALGLPLQPDSCRILAFRIPRNLFINDSIFIVLNDNNAKKAPFNIAKDFPVTSIGECDFTNNITKFYYKYQPAQLNLGQDTAICDNATLLLRAGGSDIVGWKWQDGSSQPNFLAPDAGTYTVTTTDVCGITQTDAITVAIDSNTVVQLGPDRTICQGESVELGESGFDNYIWKPIPSVDCPNCASVKAKPTVSGPIILEAGLNNGCKSRDTVMITVLPTYNKLIDTTVCYGRSVLWNGVEIEPDSARIFRLQTVAGCDSIVQVRVRGTLVGTFQLKVDTAVCLGETLPYNGADLRPGDQKTFLLTAFTGCDSTVNINVAPKDTFATEEAHILCSGETLSVFGQEESVSGIYRKTFKARNGCDSTHTFRLTVLNPIVVELEGMPTCINEATGVLTAMVGGGASPFSYNWSVSGAPRTPKIERLRVGTYQLTVTDSNNCTETAQGEVPSHPPMVYEATVDAVRCYGESNGRISLATQDPTLSFSIDGKQYFQTKKFDQLPAGAYTLYAQDGFGCNDTLALAVAQPDQLVVELPADTTVQLGDSLSLRILSNTRDSLLYAWSNTAYLSCLQCPNPIARPLRTTRYTLTVTDPDGCEASDFVQIAVVRVNDIFVPNAVSKDVSNEANSRFEPQFGPSVAKVERFQVYDRWGNMAHEARNALPGDGSLVWDGRQSGKLAPPGVYIWVLSVELVNGAKEMLSGDVTLLR